jgi:hypothetical protein
MNYIAFFFLLTTISLLTGLGSMIAMSYDKKRIQIWGKIAIGAFLITIFCILFGLTYLFLFINDLV